MLPRLSFVMAVGVDCTHRGSRQSFTLGAFAPPDDLIVGINERRDFGFVISLRCNEALDLAEQFLARRIDFVRPVGPDDFA